MKPKLILSTVGTSIGNGVKSLRSLQGQKLAYDERLDDFEKALKKKIAQTNLDDSGQLRRLSAELNVLDRLELKKNDRVVLFATDHALGRVCANALKEIIEKQYEAFSQIHRIEDLQVHDAEALRKRGLINFVKTAVDDYLDNDEIKYAYDIVLNPVGGYKGILPFLTILGMIYARPSVYLFEFAEELITLPPLPITFDLKVYERVKDALKFIEEGVVSKEAYISKIVGYSPEEEQLFMSFVEVEDDLLTLSPLSYVFLKMDIEQEVSIDKEAYEKLQNIHGQKSLIIERLIQNSANPLWRNQHLHRWSNSDFLIMKPGNTSERIAGFMQNGSYHVALIFPNHDEYEKELPKFSVKDFKNREFIPFRPKNIEAKRDISTYEKLQDEYDRMQFLMKEIEEDNLHLMDEVEKFSSRNREIEEHLESLEETNRKLNDELVSLRSKETQFKSLSFFQKLQYLFGFENQNNK